MLFPINVFASSIVIDADTNRVLYGNNYTEKKLIASTTKILTAMVVINNTNLEDLVTIDERILKSIGSNIYIEVGEEIKVIDLLYGLLLRSGNDAAIALADYTGGSEEGFLLMMNSLAKSIGMKESTFVSVSGLEISAVEGNTSTAYDMAILMQYAMQNDIFKEITGTKRHKVKTNYKSYDWYNKNKLLFEYKYTTGGKTGFTKKARRTLVTSASKNNINLIAVTLKESDDFNKHKEMYENIFKNYKKVKVVDKNNIKEMYNLYLDSNIYLTIKNDEKDKINIEIQNVENNTEIKGYLLVKLDNKTIIKRELKEINKENKKSNLIENIKDKIKRIFNL